MAEGWAEHAGTRHHGAHGRAAARALGVVEEDFLDFSQNINPLGAPPAALAAARAALDRDTGRYPDLSYSELREALGAYLGVEPERIVPTNGGAEALFLAARAARGTGRAVVLEPTFSEYAPAAGAAGLSPDRRVAHRPEDGFRLDMGALEDLDNVGLVFLCNPNNPTGGLLGRDAVMEVAARVGRAGAALVVDEAFVDFAPEASVADLVNSHLLVTRSFTKFFGIPGLRLGCLVCQDAGRVLALQPSWPVNAVAAAAGVAAVGDERFTGRSIREVARLRQDLVRAISEIEGLEVFPGAANFLLARGPEGLTERLARRGVLVRGCTPFAGLGPGFFRVAVRDGRNNAALVEALRGTL